MYGENMTTIEKKEKKLYGNSIFICAKIVLDHEWESAKSFILG